MALLRASTSLRAQAMKFVGRSLMSGCQDPGSFTEQL